MNINHRYKTLVSSFLPKKYTFRLILTFCLVLAAAFCNVVAPLVLKDIVDSLTNQHHFPGVMKLFFLYSSILILGRIFFEAKFVVYAKWEQLFVKQGFDYIFNILLKNSPGFFKSHIPGSITSRIFQSIFGLKVFLFSSIFHLLPLITEFILILFTILFVCNYQIIATIFFGVVIYALLFVYLNNKLLNDQNDVRNNFIDTQGMTTELITCWKDIKLANSYRTPLGIFSKYTTQMAEKNLIFYKNRSIYGFIQAMPLCLVFIISNYLIISSAIDGKTSIGSILLLNSYLLQIIRPLETFGVLFRDISRAYTDFTGIDLILNSEQERIFNIDVEPLEFKSVTLSNVSVSGILDNVNLTIERGQKIAIVGESGAGKTTLLNLLAGLETNYQGEIFINDINIKQISLNKLRQVVSFLSSDSRLLRGSVKENILLGDISDPDLIEAALNYSSIATKVSALTDKLDTVIGDDTDILSAGEKQRLKIARTFLLKGSVKVFDESTSALDPILEEKIINNIISDRDSTVIFVTHKLMHLSKFDNILIIKNKKIIEEGRHNNLITIKGEYFKLWSKQSGSVQLQAN